MLMSVMLGQMFVHRVLDGGGREGWCVASVLEALHLVLCTQISPPCGSTEGEYS